MGRYKNQSSRKIVEKLSETNLYYFVKASVIQSIKQLMIRLIGNVNMLERLNVKVEFILII
jgi:hypothetical protein